MFRFHYLNDAPIISVDSDARLDDNANGPSLIRCPEWLRDRPGRYLLYFAHHEGKAIRLAYSDTLTGPWQLHEPDPLVLANSLFATRSPMASEVCDEARSYIEAGADGDYPHIASPEAWVDREAEQIRLYYHGRMRNGLQRTRVSLSRDATGFSANDELLGLPYMRIFWHDGWYYAIAMPAQLYRSRDGISGFEAGPVLTDAAIRHHAVLQCDDRCYVFWTRVGDTPERILVSKLDTGRDWRSWCLDEPSEVHRARQPWEGADLPADASEYGAVMHRVNQLRDPAIFEDRGRIYLLYAIAGERGIAIGRLEKT